MQIKSENNKIIIEIPINELAEKQEDSPYMPMIVLDKQKMVEWILNNFLTFKIENDHTDLNEFELFLDHMFIEAYSSGEAWLQGLLLNNNTIL